MMLHLVTTAAVFVDQVQQAPMVAQCVQPAPEPEWKWWLGALAPWVGPLLSGLVSIYIAWRVFRWQGKKDRAQWLLDQKKAEWRELLDLVRECCFDLAKGLDQRGVFTLESKTESLERLTRVSAVLETRVFIDRSILKPLISQYAAIFASVESRSRATDDSVIVDGLYRDYLALIEAVREAAKKDLET